MRRCMICGAAHVTCGPEAHLVTAEATAQATGSTAPLVEAALEILEDAVFNGVTIMPDRQLKQGDLIADRTLYVDSNGAVVEGDNPDRVTKIVSAGLVLSKADAERYGVTQGDGGTFTYAGYNAPENTTEAAPNDPTLTASPSETPTEDEADTNPAPLTEEKAVTGAPENKAVIGAEAKRNAGRRN